MTILEVMEKICVVVTGTTGIPGGIATLNLNILMAVQEMAEESGAEVEVLSYLDGSGDKPDFLSDRVAFRSFGGGKTRFSTVLARKPMDADLLLFDHVTLVPPILPLWSLGRPTVVVFGHGSEAWRNVSRTSRWIFRRADLCLSNSNYTLKKMREAIGQFSGKSCLLGLSPNFDLNNNIDFDVDNDLVLTAVDGQKHKLKGRVLLLVGRMMAHEPGKGRWPLLQILPDLIANYRDVQVVFPGPGNERRELADFARRLGVGENVFTPGFVSSDKLDRLYRQCFAYVMPSRQEGFGLVYLEAMNYAKPCIGCWNDGAQDVIVNNETGYLVDKGSYRELFDAITALLEDPAEAREFGINGFERLHDNFTSAHFRNRLREKLAGLM
ncbi:glycosyltransferase family 4 protein [Salinibacter ruber]|uniref:glycosyltransferase family 4 protein n=1 Tax=Salinibacter ruber TaxID=146919 RepID=UPI0021697AB5|nr:glycosyltransferase family 4 protein [Salinibacter ruber]